VSQAQAIEFIIRSFLDVVGRVDWPNRYAMPMVYIDEPSGVWIESGTVGPDFRPRFRARWDGVTKGWWRDDLQAAFNDAVSGTRLFKRLVAEDSVTVEIGIQEGMIYASLIEYDDEPNESSMTAYFKRADFGRVAEIRDHLTRLLKVLGHE